MAGNRTAPKSVPILNRLLALLAPGELKRMLAGAERVELPRRTRLEHPNKKIDQIYFLESGVLSIVANSVAGNEVEVGIIGREGMSGLAVLHSADRSPFCSYMQVAGAALCVDADAVRGAMKRDPHCSQLFLNFAQTFALQVGETAVANAHATLVERLARWLLMVQDRVGGDVIPMTHEFLSLMIGARRAGVTEAIHVLADRALVSHSRGQIAVTNRAGLEACAGRYYGVPEKEYRRLIGV